MREAGGNQRNHVVKTKISPTIVGAFVIGAFALIIVGLLSFGGINLFSKPQRFVVYFDESVNGLGLGSPVKLRGVPVGRVADLNIRYDDGRDKKSMVVVVCEFNKDLMTDNRGVLINVADRAELGKLITGGLRAQLVPQGLATGLLFVQLDFLDPEEFPLNPNLTDPKYIVVPAVQSAILEFQTSAIEILGNLRKIDFAGISKGLTALMADARKQLEGVDIKGMTDQWKKTGARVEELVRSPDFKRTFDNLNATADDLRKTIAKLDAQVEPTGHELTATLAEARKTIESFNDTATVARNFINTHAGLGGEMVETLDHLNEAADAIKRLADFLERNPNALLTGKKRP